METTLNPEHSGITRVLGVSQRLDCNQANEDELIEVQWDSSIHLKLKNTNACGDVVFNIGGQISKAKVIEFFRYQ